MASCRDDLSPALTQRPRREVCPARDPFRNWIFSVALSVIQFHQCAVRRNRGTSSNGRHEPQKSGAQSLLDKVLLRESPLHFYQSMRFYCFCRVFRRIWYSSSTYFGKWDIRHVGLAITPNEMLYKKPANDRRWATSTRRALGMIPSVTKRLRFVVKRDFWQSTMSSSTTLLSNTLLETSDNQARFQRDAIPALGSPRPGLFTWICQFPGVSAR